MLHLLLHLVVPLVVALVFYRGRWQIAFLAMVATLGVDLDHLLATPIYDPERCSIGFHPLHTGPAIVVYALLFALPLVVKFRQRREGWRRALWFSHIAGLGLLIHMMLDWSDCLI